MGLAGYVDRDRKNNDLLNDSIETSLGWSFYKREKLKEVTKPDIKEPEIIGVYSHAVVVPSDIITVYEKEIKKLIHYMGLIDIEELQAYCWAIKKRKYDWIECLQVQCQEIWSLLKQIFEMKDVIVYEDDLESLVRFFVNANASNKLKFKMIYDYFLCRISAMNELNDDEQVFIKVFEKNWERHKILSCEKSNLINELEKELSALQIFESILKNDEQKEYENALNILIAEKKNVICSLEEQQDYLEKQMSEIKEIIDVDRKKYGELRSILEYGHR